MFLPDCLYKIIFGWKNRRGKNQNHHYLSCGIALSNQDMAKQTIACILVIGLYLKGFEHILDVSYYCICLCILNLAADHVYHIMSVFTVYTCYNLAMITVENCMHLMSVMIRIVHSNNRRHFSKRLH